MEIREYQESDLHKLFEYWKRMGTHVPYFFPVPASRWQTCLLNDELDGERIFKRLETYFVTEDDRVLGFVQYGQPNFAWDEKGQKYPDPDIGVLRHLYFDEGRNDVGEALLTKANDYLARFRQKHAFYHIMGMSCNARHGKLHSSQFHVDRLLAAHGFAIEHENIYYELDMRVVEPVEHARLHFGAIAGEGTDSFEVQLDGETVGTAQVNYLDALTGGETRDIVYLGWIGVREQPRGEGVGTEFLHLLVEYLLSKGCRYLHTDTAGDNVRAQRFYEARGFQSRGRTRCYVKV